MSTSLPVEILSHIFEFLPLNDRLQCCLVNKEFYWAFKSSSSRLHAKTWIVFDSDELLSDHFPTILAADRTIGGLHLRDISLSFLHWANVLEPFMSQLSSLVLENCSISPKDLFLILRHATSLKSLGLLNCRQLFIPGLTLFKPDESQILESTLAAVTELDLSENQFINDCLFEELLKCLPSLKSIKLDGCKIYNTQFTTGGSRASPSILTTTNFIAALTEKSSNIKKLSFNNSSAEGIFLNRLSQVPGLNITDLNIGRCLGVSQDAILDFCNTQKNITRLNMDFCRRILVDYPQKSLTLFQSLWKLTHLSMKGLSMPKGFSECIAQLDYLTELDLSDADIPDSHVANGIKNAKFNLEKLTMINYVFNPESLILMLPRLSNLSELNLNFCACAVTDSSLQAITRTLRKLRKLHLNNCARLTDLGFTGIQSQIPQERTGIYRMTQDDGKIFLGTSAEAGILQEVQKQKEVRAIVSTANEFASTISDLNLTLLEVAHTNLSDYSFILTFNFRELRHMDLTGCKHLTDEGFVTMACKNLSLEKLVVKRTNITDYGLIKVLRHLPRLVHLDLEGCSFITSNSIQTLAQFCLNLRYLNVSLCLKVRANTIENLERRMSSLRKVEMRGLHIGEYLEDSE